MTTTEGGSSDKPEMRFLTTSAGHEIATYDYGGSGPTIVFAHAASFHGQIWNRVIQRLDQTYRFISFDFFGHGKSSGSATKPSPLNPSWLGLFADVPEILGQLSLTQPVFGVGHSLGGAGLVSAQLLNPALFSAIWTYEPIIFEQDLKFSAICEAMASIAEQRRPAFPSRPEARTEFAARPPFDAVDRNVLADYVKHGFVDNDHGIELRCTPANEALTYRNGANLALFAALQDLDVEVLFGFGAIDPSAAAQAAKLSAAIPKGHFEAFDGLGHLGPLENPQTIADSISGFFGDLAQP